MPITPLPGEKVLANQTATVRVNVAVLVQQHGSTGCLPRFLPSRTIKAGCGYLSCDYTHTCADAGAGLPDNIALSFDPSPDSSSLSVSQGGTLNSSGGSAAVSETVTFASNLRNCGGLSDYFSKPCGCIGDTYVVGSLRCFDGPGENATSCTITGTV